MRQLQRYIRNNTKKTLTVCSTEICSNTLNGALQIWLNAFDPCYICVYMHTKILSRVSKHRVVAFLNAPYTRSQRQIYYTHGDRRIRYEQTTCIQDVSRGNIFWHRDLPSFSDTMLSYGNVLGISLPSDA